MDVDFKYHTTTVGSAGLSVGDAFGQQFVSQPELIARRGLPMLPWRFTDDTVMGIAVTQTLEICDEIDQDDLVERFARLYIKVIPSTW